MLETSAPATRATRPLIEYPRYFERTYCPDCMIAHFVELTRARDVICHGEDYYFTAINKRTHYARRLGKGFELVPIIKPTQLEWIIAEEIKEPEYIDIEQDW